MEFQKVYEDTRQVRVEIVKGVLIDRGIEAVIVPKQDSSYQLFSRFEVHVPRDQVFSSIKIIEEEIKFE